MARPSKLLVPLIFLTLSFSSGLGEASLTEDVDFASGSSSLRIELDLQRSRIFNLDTRISGRAEELKSKDNNIKEMERIIEEKSNYIASLNFQIEALQKGSPEPDELKTKMYDRFNELSKQADNLRKEIGTQIKKENDLEVRIYTVEKKTKELNLKLESLQKISDDQKTRIRKIKHDIQFAEEELMKLKIEATLISEEMSQTYTISLWTKHGRLSSDWAIQKALYVKAIVQERAGPHIKVIKKNWIPKIKQQWLMVVVYLEPLFNEFQETSNSYLQEAHQFLKPYLTQISVTSKPHFDKFTRTLNLYTREIVQIYKRFMTSVMTHHTQVQDMVLELLKGHEYTRPFADKDIVWYLASSVFALPAILVVNLYTSIVSNKPQKHRHKQHARRRAKR